ncbi:hypothetical protein CIB48_g8568, partial [Xylaria polymorpha]
TTLGNTLVRAVPGLEVQVGGPVVAEVLAEGAGGARRGGRDVAGGHGGVEGVAAHDLVHVRRGDGARVHEGVEPVDDDLRAPEPQHREPAAAAELRYRPRERREAEDRRPIHHPVTSESCDECGVCFGGVVVWCGEQKKRKALQRPPTTAYMPDGKAGGARCHFWRGLYIEADVPSHMSASSPQDRVLAMDRSV